jgi:wobble nucleotide-excising tRNase
MITSISMHAAASFSGQQPTVIPNLKTINLLYGQNGTGKSTIGRFLQDPSNIDYFQCQMSLDAPENYEIIVYNTDFSDANFSSNDSLKGIFTLGEENIEAENAISAASQELQRLDGDSAALTEKKATKNTKLTALADKIKKTLFASKKTHENTELDYCLVGFKSSSKSFYQQVTSTKYSDTLDFSINELRQQAKEISGSNVSEKAPLPLMSNFDSIEQDVIFSEVIIGSTESYLSGVIEQLNNSDWVKQGKGYLSINNSQCPFCQQVIKSTLIQDINELFDKSYDDKVTKLVNIRDSYQVSITSLENTLASEQFQDKYVNSNSELQSLFSSLQLDLQFNLNEINKKAQEPSKCIDLKSTRNTINDINIQLTAVNKDIGEFNKKITNIDVTRKNIKNHFWKIIRHESEEVLQAFKKEYKGFQDEIDVIDLSLASNNKSVIEQNIIISENNKKITNIDESIVNINNSIASLGLEGFKIKNKEGENNHYFLQREGTTRTDNIYKSLSEGEKTLITFLYFLELCQGSTNSESSVQKNKKIIVVDDPISSLSHNYIYDIAALIQQRILKDSLYAQVFILTHNLYFFHEMLKSAPRRESTFNNRYSLFRVTKDQNSQVTPLGKNEIQNDYQSYWHFIKDAKNGNPNNAILPNMMRNILEYYFSFIHKSDDLSDKLVELESEDTEFKPLYRYINRESHSDSINILDFGEVDPIRFIDKFKLIFERTGFLEHYQVMMGEADIAG